MKKQRNGVWIKKKKSSVERKTVTDYSKAYRQGTPNTKKILLEDDAWICVYCINYLLSKFGEITQ